MTLAQWRVLWAYEALVMSGAYHYRSGHLGWWLNRRFLTENVNELSASQARQACRQLNAWRHGAKGRGRHHHNVR